MEEKILIQSKHYNVKKLFAALVISGVVLSLILFFVDMNFESWDEFVWYVEKWLNFFVIILYCIPLYVCTLIGALLYSWLKGYKLTVTDKRIYGKSAWGKRVDLPLDSVSAIATTSALKGVSVSTSSGRISFLVMKNANEVYMVISDLLIERQQGKLVDNTLKTTSAADELKKFKDLLDNGIITQEEFDEKKKQLLGL